jgi:outer membrane protein assembly factor BamD
LFEQIVPKYRGKPQAQRIIYFFAESYFQIKSYYLAAYQFENFVKTYPKSERIQEATFKAAKSYYFQSPSYSLDQEDTYTAIEKLQVFLNLYPNSQFADEANQMIGELQEKLEKKDFEIAKQYHTIRDYKAAIKANENFVSGFPGTKFREESLYIKFIASYEIAINSIDAKKQERLEELIQQYNTLLRYYPETLFLADLDKRMTQVYTELKQFDQNTTQQTK